LLKIVLVFHNITCFNVAVTYKEEFSHNHKYVIYRERSFME